MIAVTLSSALGMAHLRTIGSYIDNSGLDLCWIEADIHETDSRGTTCQEGYCSTFNYSTGFGTFLCYWTRSCLRASKSDYESSWRPYWHHTKSICLHQILPGCTRACTSCRGSKGHGYLPKTKAKHHHELTEAKVKQQEKPFFVDLKHTIDKFTNP